MQQRNEHVVVTETIDDFKWRLDTYMDEDGAL